MGGWAGFLRLRAEVLLVLFIVEVLLDADARPGDAWAPAVERGAAFFAVLFFFWVAWIAADERREVVCPRAESDSPRAKLAVSRNEKQWRVTSDK